jgi:2-(1,2-epoxy-1,2-dihydrophenyl)acetyl-CoA isomerase
VLLTGAGRGFCAGADLTDPESVPAAGQSMGQFMAGRLRGEYNPAAIAWSTLPVPLVVALNGVAAGAGASLALMGDITVAARSASLTFLFAPKLGLAPDMGARSPRATHRRSACAGVRAHRRAILTEQ